jgi:selenocysteine lyase/cysteine desulfurase
MNKRTFIKSITLLGLSAPVFGRLDSILAAAESSTAQTLAEDEDFWSKIRASYRLKPDYINLESGFYCIQPEETLEHFIKHVREVNYHGSYYMRNYRLENKARVTAKLAEMADCTPEELIITRNTTESLDTVIGGIDWSFGDEAIYAGQDYMAMQYMFELVEERYGVVRKVIDIPMHPKSDQDIVDAYARAITPRTRLLMVPHIINFTGHILPIRKVCDMAHARGVDVLVDGAHAFGHFQFSIKDLDCDFYGTSLHKWLTAPLGSGFLFAKKNQALKVWPAFAEKPTEDDDILKLNHTGTHPAHTDVAIGNAIDFQNKIGIERKETRLRFIQNYWTDQARKMDHVEVFTPIERHRSCGIATAGIKGMEPQEMAKILMDNHKIFTVPISRNDVQGCRISPNLFTSTQDMDVLVNALKSMA